MSRSGLIVAPNVAQLGREALDKVAAAVAAGAPLVQCQLLASGFYDALRHELDATPWWDGGKRRRLAGALDQCRRAASASNPPEAMLSELEGALDLLAADRADATPPGRRPALRVIDGGRG
jgi:hypothetical protein